MQQFREQPTDKAMFIAIEGATGAGKTTLATRLSEQFGASVALDPFDQNSFLPGYYRASPGQRAPAALPMEMTFLALRVGALRGIARNLSQGCPVVADRDLAALTATLLRACRREAA